MADETTISSAAEANIPVRHIRAQPEKPYLDSLIPTRP